MDQELKQRLIGAVVVTALAAIFIPMLFDDPVDQSGQVVSELVIPEAPPKASEDAANKLPASAEDVLAQPEQGLTQEEAEATVDEPPYMNDQQVSDAEYIDVGTETEEAIDESVEAPVIDEPVSEEPVSEAPVNTPPKIAPKQKPSVKPAPVKVVEQAKPAPVAQAKPAPVAQVAPKTKPAPTPERVVKPAQPKVTATEKPVAKVAESAKATASTAKSASAKPVPSLSRWYIQVGSYGQEANAMAMWNTLRKQGFPVLMETVHLPEKGTLYRLKVGPELDQKRAAAMKEKLDKQNNLKTMLRAE